MRVDLIPLIALAVITLDLSAQAEPGIAEGLGTEKPTCPNLSDVAREIGFPRQAHIQGLDEGNVLVEFTLSADGQIKNIRVIETSNPVFSAQAIRAVGLLKCGGVTRDTRIQVPFKYVALQPPSNRENGSE
jgi:periplasmic protein TonB